MVDSQDDVKKNPTPTGSSNTDLALSRDTETPSSTTGSNGGTSTQGTTTGREGDVQPAQTGIGSEFDEDDADELSGDEQTGFNLYQGAEDDGTPIAPTVKRSEEQAFLDAMATLVGAEPPVEEVKPAVEVKPASLETSLAPSEPKLSLNTPGENFNPRAEVVKETDESIANREKLKQIYPELDRMMAEIPLRDYTPVDQNVVREKAEKGQFASMDILELRAVMKLELEEPGFGAKTGFKGTEQAFKETNRWLNDVVVDSHALLAKARLSRGAGDPITLATIGTDPLNPQAGFAHRPETFDALFVNGMLDVQKLQEMQRSGQIDSKLILEPKGLPTFSDLSKMSNSLDWLNLNRSRLKEGSDRIYANGCHHVLTDIFQITDKPGWKPPAEADKLEAYNLKMTDNLNLLLRVRNLAESIQSLNNAGLDSKALEDLKKLGHIQWDQEKRQITTMNLKLPDTLEANKDNEIILQRLRDWLTENAGPADQATKEYEKGNPIRVSDVPQKGSVGQDGQGNIMYVKDADGEMQTVVSGDKIYNRNIHGTLVDAQGKPVSKAQIDEAVHRGSNVKEFDYIAQGFSTKNSATTIDVATVKDFYKDHMLNQQNLIGIPRGSLTENSSFKPWEHALVQGQTGRMELVRADRLNEFKLIQSFFHYGSKTAAIALDIGMVVSGGIGVKAALTTGSMVGVGANAFRVALGLGGFLDPALRQMGESGQMVRDLRHKAILFDVTQGLVRQGVGKVLTGGMLFQGKGAAEIAKVIEETAWMHRTEQVTRGAFMAADGVWIPLMWGAGSAKVERMRGRDPAKQMQEALINKGDGVGDSGTGFASGGTRKFDAAASAKNTFDAYAPLLGGGEHPGAKAIFDRTQQSLAAGDAAVKTQRDELIGLFNPSAETLLAWKKFNNPTPVGHIKPGSLPLEKQAGRVEKIADAISLLFLAQKDGAIADDKVLATRKITIPAYSWSTPSGSPGGRPVEHYVPSEDVEQQVTVNQVISILQNAALDSSDPQTQFVAADALWRSGSMSTGKYAGICLDIIDNDKTASKEMKMDALKQMSDLMLTKHIEETDPSIRPDSRAKAMADAYGFSETELIDKLTVLSRNEEDADVRAMCSAAIKAHDLRLEESAEAAKAEAAAASETESAQDVPPAKENAFDQYYDRWRASLTDGSKPGAFHDSFIAEQNAVLAQELPKFDKANAVTQAQLETAREDKLRAINALIVLEGEPGGEQFTKAINASLLTLASAELGDPRPDIKLTSQTVNMLIDRRAKLSDDERTKLGDIALNILDVKLLPGSTTDAEIAKTQGRANHDSAMAQLMVIGQLQKIFEGPEFSSQRILAEDSLRLNYLSTTSIGRGWGQHGMMRVAAIQGLTSLGKGENDNNIRAIADRLRTDSKGFYERDAHVRSAALQALLKMEPGLFGLSAEELSKRQLANVRPDNLLKFERDSSSVETLYAAHDKLRAYQDPDKLPTVADYSRQVEEMLAGAKTTVSDQEVLQWIKQHEGQFGLLDQKILMDQAQKAAAKHLWSGIGGWFSYTFKSQATVDSCERDRANSVEKYVIRRRDRDSQFEELTNFKNLQPADREMAIKTLMYIVKSGDQKLFEADEQVTMRINAAKALSDIAAWSNANNDRVENKDLLTACVVSALTKSADDLPGEAKLYLIDAVNSMVKRDFGTDLNSGKKLDYSGLSPDKAGAIFAQVLERENSQFSKTSKEWGVKISDEHKRLQSLSKQVQLDCIDAIHELRYMGAFPVLRARGPDKVLDPANPGSYIQEVKDRSKLAVESLYYGTAWVKHDAPFRLTGTPEGDAAKIASQLIGEQPQHSQYLVSDMFASAKDRPIADLKDQRVAVLQEAIGHPDQRVRLASATILAESGLPTDSKVKVDATLVLRELSGHQLSGHAGANDVRAAMRSIIESAGNALTGNVATDASKLGTMLGEKKPPTQLIDDTAKAIISSFKFAPLDGKDDIRVPALQSALQSGSERVRVAAALAIADSKLTAGEPLFDAATNILKEASVLGGLEIWRMEAADVLLKAKQSEYPGVKIGNLNALLEGVGWMRAGSTKLGADQSDTARAASMVDAIQHSSKDFNHEKAAVSIFAACADKPITTQDDSRREVLQSALKHPEERVRLAAAWMLSESAVALDRESGVKTLTTIATNFEGNTAGKEAQQILSSMIRVGSLDDQLLVYTTWKAAFEAGHKEGAVGPEAIPEHSIEQTVSYFSRADRKELNHLINDGSNREREAVILALTGWSAFELQSHVRAAYDAVKAPKIDSELFRERPLIKMQSCLGAGPKRDESFKLSLFGYDNANKPVDVFGYGSMKPGDIEDGLNSVLAALKSGAIPVKQSLDYSGKPFDRLALGDINWNTFRELSKQDFTVDRKYTKSNELAKLSDKLRSSMSEGQSASATWRPAALGERPPLNQPEKSATLTDEKVESLYFGISWINRNVYEQEQPAAVDAKTIEKLLDSHQPNNGRYVVEAILKSFAEKPIESADDPRRTQLFRGLSNESERVRLASAWMLANSKVDGDLKLASSTLAEIAVDSKYEIARKEAQSLLRDVIELGGDAQKDIALGAWRFTYDTAGAKRAEANKPPTFDEVDQARKHIANQGAENVLRKTFDERKAILMHMWNVNNPNQWVNDGQVEAWLQPSQASPVLDSTLKLFDLRANSNLLKSPFDRRVDSVPELFGMNKPTAEGLFGGANRYRINGWSGTSDGASRNDLMNQLRVQTSKDLQSTLDHSSLKGTRVKLDDNSEIVINLDPALLGGRGKLPVTISGGAHDDAIKFMNSASEELTARFAKDLLKYRPELASQAEIPAADLAIMFKNWIDQKALGCEHVVISEIYNEPVVDQIPFIQLAEGQESRISSKEFATTWSEVSKKRDAYRETTLNRFISAQLRVQPAPNDDKPHWKPSGPVEVKAPKFLIEPPLQLIDRYRTDVSNLLPASVLKDATEHGGIRIDTLRWLADSARGADISVAPGLSDRTRDTGFSVTDPKDQAIINTIRAQRVQRRLYNFNYSTKPNP
jgi:hypothetical protein